MKTNLPPFYVGQKVVCVPSPAGELINETLKETIVVGESYEVKRCYWVSMLGLSYWATEVIGMATKWDSLSFRPLEKTTFPLMKFTAIKEKEKEEILIEN